jgi:hypothetical protein
MQGLYIYIYIYIYTAKLPENNSVFHIFPESAPKKRDLLRDCSQMSHVQGSNRKEVICPSKTICGSTILNCADNVFVMKP